MEKERKTNLQMTYPWISTKEYVRQLENNKNFTKETMENLFSESLYSVILQNIKWYKEINFEPSEDVIHCFSLKRNEETERYFHEVPENDVVFLFEEESRYTYSNSPSLFKEERLRQGVSTADIKSNNIRYREYRCLYENLEDNPR